MKKYIVLLLITAVCMGMQRQKIVTDVTCRYAQVCDIPLLLECIERASQTADAENIVILPQLFRKEALEKAIEERTLFVAYHENKLIGFKKLFVLKDEVLHDILEQEIRCTIQESVEGDTAHIIDATACYLYTGADYTVPEYRHDGRNYLGLSVNKKLLDFALSQQQIVSSKLIVVFGVTELNAGDGILASFHRPQSIQRSIIDFLTKLRGYKPSIRVTRYHAIKPTFDFGAQHCIPLSDEYGVRGYGYVLEEQI